MSTQRISELNFLQIIYDHFEAKGMWSDVRTVQLRVGAGQNVRRLAAEIGGDKVICEEQQEGVCFLKLEGMALCDGSDRDIANFLGVIRMAGAHYAEYGRQKITADDIQKKLGVDDADAFNVFQFVSLGVLLLRAEWLSNKKAMAEAH